MTTALTTDQQLRLVRREVAGAQLAGGGLVLMPLTEASQLVIAKRLSSGLPAVPDWLVDVPRLALATGDGECE